jgi:hypothetical protein
VLPTRQGFCPVGTATFYRVSIFKRRDRWPVRFRMLISFVVPVVSLKLAAG